MDGAIRRGCDFLLADPEALAPQRLPSLELIDSTIPTLLERVAGQRAFESGRYGIALNHARMAQWANADRCALMRAWIGR